MNQAVVLAGGEGSRLFPITSWMPKPLLPVRGVPILVHILRKLKREGWTDIVVCVNEGHRELFEYHTSALQDELAIRLSTHPRSEEIGTAGELAAAARFIHGDRFLVYYGDVLSRIDTAEMREKYDAHNRPAAVVAVASRYQTDKGIATLDGDLVKELSEKPALEMPNLMGIDLLRYDALEEMSIGEDLHRDVLTRLLARGHTLVAHVVDDDFVDVGSMEGYRRAQTYEM